MSDELRERAKELRNLAPDPDVPYLVPSTKEVMALAMRSAASEMDDAADTIWELRDDLQRANTENAKLRELVHDLLQLILADGFDCYGCVHEDCNGMQYTDKCKLLDRARDLGIEVDA